MLSDLWIQRVKHNMLRLVTPRYTEARNPANDFPASFGSSSS